MSIIVPVVLSGGTGSRLWPVSREGHPKQFLPLVTDASLLQDTVSRVNGLTDQAPIVVGNEEHRFMLAEQLRAIGVTPAALILEPSGRNTAPAVALAALYAQRSSAEGCLLLVLPADHAISDVAAFQAAVVQAAKVAEQGRLMTFGVVPTTPETGYGYIKAGADISGSAQTIEAFVEKPDLASAQQYLSSGNFLWNSGMFLLPAHVYLDELQRLAPDIYQACVEAIEGGTQDLDFCRPDAQAFANSPSDSIDYAVMEHTKKGAVLPLDCGWNDVGAWSALWSIQAKDERGNVSQGDVLLNDCDNSYFRSSERLIAGVGLQDMVVVETADAILVSHRDQVQEVKSIVNTLKLQKRSEVSLHQEVFRPWGSYETLVLADRFQVKRIVVKPGAKLSLQMHHHRAEHWIVVKGTAEVTCEDRVFMLAEDESTYIPLGHKHRLANPGKIPLELIEVQSGSYLGEDDIVRFDDTYGRAPQGNA
ncbi:MAG: mannose-1-phosphate guanylyltransferase/mannose-6-phosphate isomerase [Halieaceae bacterium]|nr:mannose-1-phosphate guanylyltransferase/mannose-6-phosphate isomerase [Halieaceae bacterium]